jgi:hypothetical protein
MTKNSIRDRYKPISKNTKTLDPLLYERSTNRVPMGANQSLLFLFNAACLAEKQQIPIL